jgi:hypothetical protein
MLKNGTTPDDPRLGRIPQYDERNLQFNVRRLQLPTELRSYTWSVGSHLNQGSEGSCVGFSFAHELLARPQLVRGVDAAAARRLYWRTQKEDPWPGGAYAGADPFYEGTSVLTAAKVLKDIGVYKSYWWAVNAYDLATAIGYHGPAVIGINWWTGMMRPDDAGWIHPTGIVEGGHAILVYRYSKPSHAFAVWNSWGPQWGKNGTAWVNEPDMDALLADEGEACVPLRSSKVDFEI